MSQNSFINHIIVVCQALQSHSVEYLVVGGTAVGFHGYYRPSKTSDDTLAEKDDLDFWYNPTYSNYFNLLKALNDLGLNAEEFLKEQTSQPETSFFKYNLSDFTLDFLPKIPGHAKFRDCYKRRVVSIIEDVEISILSFDDLIVSKGSTNRKKDIEDIKALMAYHKRTNK